MRSRDSACEVPVAARASRPGRARIARFDAGTFRWTGVPERAYKGRADGPLRWQDVARFVLVGGSGEPTAFQLRYFEIAPGGFSSLERHRHAHAVIVLRGRGRVRIGEVTHRLRPMDFVYIPPDVPHQFKAGREPFGFLCPVDAIRDRPRAVTAGGRRGVRPAASTAAAARR